MPHISYRVHEPMPTRPKITNKGFTNILHDASNSSTYSCLPNNKELDNHSHTTHNSTSHSSSPVDPSIRQNFYCPTLHTTTKNVFSATQITITFRQALSNNTSTDSPIDRSKLTTNHNVPSTTTLVASSQERLCPIAQGTPSITGQRKLTPSIASRVDQPSGHSTI